MKTLKVLTASLTALVGLGLPVAAHSQASAELTDGEIRKVDKDAKKLTIKHSEIKNLEMPGMTMVFQVKDPTLLDKLQAGDKVKFRAEKDGSSFVVTQVEAVKADASSNQKQ